ncbi:hypothetical protein C0995_005858 [Termitomyces sp. Mi166|nr:hypothetical protein C0995_005858 [Termitomyces sp. Mi166\
MLSFISIVTLSVATTVSAAIGLNTNLYIVNGDIAPDGFTRSAVLASGTPTDATFPGALITAKKHSAMTKGDHMRINVVNSLNDTTMLTSTSIETSSTPRKHLSSLVPTATQYCDGLRGPIVVYDPGDPFRRLYHTPAPSAGLVPTFDTTLINGLGRTLNGDATPLAVINVIPGKRYRFRLTIIEVDGVNHEPLTVDSLQIFAGQRYSVVVAANQPVGNYWIRAQPNIGVVVFDGGLNSAILRYQGADIEDPETNSTLSNPLVETNLHPLKQPGAPGGNRPADVSHLLDIQFQFDTFSFTINNASFTTPTMPVLLQIMSGAQSATDLLPSDSVYVLPRNKIIELTIPGGAVGAPVRRDVVSTGLAGDNVTIRFKTDNSGPWFLHCHIDWHLEIGLAIVFAEDVPTIAKSKPSRAWYELCPLYNNATGSKD